MRTVKPTGTQKRWLVSVSSMQSDGTVRGLTDSLLLVEVTIAVWGRVGLVCAEVSLSPLMLGEAENLPISPGLVIVE